MGTISELRARFREVSHVTIPFEVDGGGGGGDDGRMEQRIAALEAANLETRDRLIKIETRMEALASKEDLQKLRSELHESLNAQTWKIIGAAATLSAVVFFLARFVVPHT
ncbi:hypothetical protein BSFA1_42450 [Burkholderia sp. SFA1]|nr:hypothetical protein BSFA1_42450 [Burkholderia sp. SFA1]